MSVDINKIIGDVRRGAQAVAALNTKKQEKEEPAAKTGTGYVEYTGGDTQLDKAISGYSQKYTQGREKALAGDPQGITEMREANDSANQLRNAKGYAAQLADKDIAYVKGQMGYGQSGSGGSSVRGSGGVSAPEIKDYSDYIQAMAEAKKEAALRQLQAAYEKNLAQLEQARGEIAPTYEAARNRAAGQAAQSRRQFNEYAAVHGLGSGAGSQAQLALSNDLQDITPSKSWMMS